MKKFVVVAAMLAMAVPVSMMAEDKKVEAAAAAPAKETVQTVCPILDGNKINKETFVDVDGKRVYVCCKACIEAVKKDGAAIVKKIEASGIKLEAAPKADEKKVEAK